MQVRYVRDLEPAAWIRERLHPFAQDLSSLIPSGFDDYARVFHPAHRGASDRRVTWRAIADANGRTVHPEVQFATSPARGGAASDRICGRPRRVKGRFRLSLRARS